MFVGEKGARVDAQGKLSLFLFEFDIYSSNSDDFFVFKTPFLKKILKVINLTVIVNVFGKNKKN